MFRNENISQNSEELLLSHACENNDLIKVKELIMNGVKPNCDNGYPIYIACNLGFSEIVQFLLENGVRVNDDLLRIACRSGHLSVAKILVEKGADVRIHDHYTIEFACGKGNLDLVKFLVSKGCDIHADNDESLVFACEEGHAHIVEYLIQNGANPSTQNGLPLRICVERHENECEYIVRKALNLNKV